MVDRGAPPPADMGAEVDHDGVVWRLGGQPGLQLAAVSTLIAMGAGGVVVGTWAIAAAVLLAIIPGLVFAQASRRSTIRITLRSVVVETRGLLGRTTRERFPLDEIREVKVAASDSGDWALLVVTDATRHRIAPRARREHLDWLCERVEQARSLFAEHERREGREWSFLRKVPDELDDLLQQHAPETPPRITRP